MTVLRRRLPQVLWLTVVWVLLWGVVSVKIVLGGLLVAIAVTALFPLPVLPRLPLRPWPLLRLAAFVAVDLVVSSWQVSRETVRHGPRARAGVVAVPLYARSDRVIAVVAGLVVLTPGSSVLQIDRPGRLMYVYALGGLRGPEDAEHVRSQTMTLQRRVLAALGTSEELSACLRGERETGQVKAS